MSFPSLETLLGLSFWWAVFGSETRVMFFGILDSLILSAFRTIVVALYQKSSLIISWREAPWNNWFIIWVLWYSYYLCSLGRFCDCKDFSFKNKTTWRATQTSNVGTEWNKVGTEPELMTSILINILLKWSLSIVKGGLVQAYIPYILRTFFGRVELTILKALIFLCASSVSAFLFKFGNCRSKIRNPAKSSGWRNS